MFPKVFSIGSFFLPTYGVLVTLGFLAGLSVVGKLAKRRGMDAQLVMDLGIYVALAGLAGAKLLMILYDFDTYLKKPSEIFSLATLQAGGVFHGGLIAALLVAVWYLRSRKLPFLPVADVFAPGIALGHAIGRLGCFAAGCCWGDFCERPWAVRFTDPEAGRLVGVPLGVPLHPTQLYEAAAEFAIFAFLYLRSREQRPAGTMIGLYLMLYPAARFFVEFVRSHDQPNPFGWPLSLAQWASAGLFLVGFWLLRKSQRAAT
ncbi:MAG: prolipoprotein diacylglyceryl transferase [Candidatus Solibacter usitatus]|nr:prolipoprotein diacylglyceryl transferase [Candidatus Solibacter usitatus]